MEIVMTTLFRSLTCIAIFLLSASCFAQTPDTEIFLGKIGYDAGKPVISEIINITDRNGYDNQPYFTRDSGGILYTAQYGDQTDIYLYTISDKKTRCVNNTQTTSEYSPTLIPGEEWYSCIQVEEDGTQRLWKFPVSGGKAKLVLEHVKPVGYHAWTDESTVVMFVLASQEDNIPVTMQIADARTGESEVVTTNIGRSMHKIPGRASISFVDQKTDSWTISEFNVKKRTISKLTGLVKGNEHYCWTPNGLLVMGSGTKLYFLNPETDTNWTEIGDYSSAGLKAITRLAVSPDGKRIAIVATK